MKIAVPIWQNTVSSVFDFAHKLLLVDLENNVEQSREKIDLDITTAPERLGRLKQLGVNVLICGALSRPMAEMIESSGVELLPFVTGPVEQILDAYKAGKLDQQKYAMPGCWKGARKCFRRQRRRYRGRRNIEPPIQNN